MKYYNAILVGAFMVAAALHCLNERWDKGTYFVCLATFALINHYECNR